MRLLPGFFSEVRFVSRKDAAQAYQWQQSNSTANLSNRLFVPGTSEAHAEFAAQSRNYYIHTSASLAWFSQTCSRLFSRSIPGCLFRFSRPVACVTLRQSRDAPTDHLKRLAQRGQPQLAVALVGIEVPPLVTACHHMVSGPGILDAFLAYHRRSSWTRLTHLSTLATAFRDPFTRKKSLPVLSLQLK
jgi:hypothetical protein